MFSGMSVPEVDDAECAGVYAVILKNQQIKMSAPKFNAQNECAQFFYKCNNANCFFAFFSPGGKITLIRKKTKLKSI